MSNKLDEACFQLSLLKAPAAPLQLGSFVDPLSCLDVVLAETREITTPRAQTCISEPLAVLPLTSDDDVKAHSHVWNCLAQLVQPLSGLADLQSLRQNAGSACLLGQPQDSEPHDHADDNPPVPLSLTTYSRMPLLVCLDLASGR